MGVDPEVDPANLRRCDLYYGAVTVAQFVKPLHNVAVL